LTQPIDEHAHRIEDHILRDLDRSKEAFVAHYRDESKRNQNGGLLPSAYESMPTWVAVEALSFGTLSRCIQAADGMGVLDDIADEISVSRTVLASQVRSFVYLRNRIAHHARLWNHSVLDAPMTMPKMKRRAFRDHRGFKPRSVYAVLVALDGLLSSSQMERGWLTRAIDPILAGNRLLADGLTDPRKYGDMDLHLSGPTDIP
jgi:abortive infection bacteriophage resistance protein